MRLTYNIKGKLHECTSVFFCQFNYFILIDTTTATTTTTIHNCADTHFFSFFPPRIFVFFQLLPRVFTFSFRNVHPDRGKVSFGVNYEPEFSSVILHPRKFYIPRGGTNGVSGVVQPLNILLPRFKAVFLMILRTIQRNT